METQGEVTRLRQVYDGYAACGFGQSKWSDANRGNQAIRAERDLKIRELLRRSGFFPLAGKRVLDVGCGTGELLGLFEDWGASPEGLFGIDLIPSRIAAAQQKFPRISFQQANAESLPFDDGFFDLVAVLTVFTSILDRRMAQNISREVTRVLAPNGAVIWYDLRVKNPFNKHVRSMSRRQVECLFPGLSQDFTALSLLPPLARRLGSLTTRLYSALSSLPCLRTHLLGLLTKTVKT